MSESGPPPADGDGSRARAAGKSVYRTVIDVVLTGLVVILPLVVTLYILNAVLDIIRSVIDPVIRLLAWSGVLLDLKQFAAVQVLITAGIYSDTRAFLAEMIAVTLLLVVVLVLGTIGRMQYGERLIDYFDKIIGAVPAIGTIYASFRRMGDVMLESGVENFREVKLVEFPRDGVFVLGFVTNTAPFPIADEVSMEGMTTLFLPLAPNPVMGGFLTYIPDERIRDVDMTVEDAVRTIVTSGIATEEPEEGGYRQLSEEERADIEMP